jgi:hypothetical protein
MVNSHAWPRFGGDRVRDFIASHRDAYKYLHDQTVRLMNAGYTDREIAEQVRLPASLSARWFNHGYYGTMMHNSRAIYQRYMGWYDGNPANLNPLPPAEEGDALRARHGRRRSRACRRPARVRRRRLSLGRARAQQSRVRKSEQHRGAPTARAHASADGVPGRERDLAQHVSCCGTRTGRG